MTIRINPPMMYKSGNLLNAKKSMSVFGISITYAAEARPELDDSLNARVIEYCAMAPITPPMLNIIIPSAEMNENSLPPKINVVRIKQVL